MRLNALVPYFGAKRQMADRIIEVAGPHTAWWEPFCGSMAVILAKPACRMEVVNDLNGGVVNLARVVADDDLAPRLYDRLVRTMFCQNLYAGSCEWISNSTREAGVADLDWAYHYFIMSWQGRNGLVGTVGEARTGFCKRHTSGGGDPAVRFRNVTENIPAWWKRLRGVTILCEDGLALIGRIEDREGTVVYVDPPYLSKKGEYLHDFTPAQHAGLAASLASFEKTRIVVSYYRHDGIESLYPSSRWQTVGVDVQKNMAVAQGESKAAPEILLVNSLT